MIYYDNYGPKHNLVEAKDLLYDSGTIDTHKLQEIITLMYGAKEGHCIAYKEGRLQWVKLPPQFKEYLETL